MNKCEYEKDCPFFNQEMPYSQELEELFKLKYCNNSFKQCARYLIASNLGSENVPSDLYPNMTDRARKILKENSAL